MMMKPENPALPLNHALANRLAQRALRQARIKKRRLILPRRRPNRMVSEKKVKHRKQTQAHLVLLVQQQVRPPQAKANLAALKPRSNRLAPCCWLVQYEETPAQGPKFLNRKEGFIYSGLLDSRLKAGDCVRPAVQGVADKGLRSFFVRRL